MGLKGGGPGSFVYDRASFLSEGDYDEEDVYMSSEVCG